jgi:hypothetical protein
MDRATLTLLFVLCFMAVDKALKSVEQILEVHRHPQLAEDVDHEYEDKYELANRMTNTAIIAEMNCLERMGLTSKVLKAMDASKSTTLRFQASENCTFLKDQLVEVQSEHSHEKVEESQSTSGGSSFFGSTKKSTIHKYVKKVKEYHWTVDMHWEISIFSGTNVDKKIVLKIRDSSSIVVTQSERAPLEESREHPVVDLSLTWLLQQIDVEKGTAKFTIDAEKSKTPRRNEQVDKAMDFFCSRMTSWVRAIKLHFSYHLQLEVINKNNPVIPEPANPPSLGNSCSAVELFHPIVPLMEDKSEDSDSEIQPLHDNDVTQPKSTLSLASPLSSSDDDKKVGLLLSGDDSIKLLNEQVRSLEQKLQSLQNTFPSAHLVKLISIAEATLFLLCDHSEKLSQQYQYSMQYMEKMLEDQLIMAIGKRVSTADLEQFVRFHNAKFLALPPKPFCHAIGRPNHFPYGVLSIESQGESDSFEPIETLVREVESPSSLKIPLNAATTLELTGKTYLHGWMNHRSQETSHQAYQLSARARQFSSFLLVVGTMAGPDQLKPKDAIILQNKDEVIIELLLEELPSAKEFKDAIQSLSPEQQSFAKSFRSMQLESSVFGVCVIQIKPQLEALLGLPEDSLAKEIKLTEDLMQLFVEYQVPSDLLSYDGDCSPTISTRDKVDNVREHVKAVLDVIDGTKEKQLEQRTMEADMAVEAAVADGAGAGSSYSRPDDMKVRKLKKKAAGRSLEMASSSSVMMQSAPMVRLGMAPPPPPGALMANTRDVNRSVRRSEPAEAPMLSTESFGKVSDAVSTEPTSQSKAFDSTPSTSNNAADFTSMPKLLDSTIEKYNKDSALRSTKIKTSDTWSRCRQENLLTKAVKTTLYSSEVKTETNKAFDLLDALSRSGSLPIAYSDLHVVLCVTHCFEKDVMDTVVQDNINPIERLELSTLLLASTIHGTFPTKLIAEDTEKKRFESTFPLFIEG